MPFAASVFSLDKFRVDCSNRGEIFPILLSGQPVYVSGDICGSLFYIYHRFSLSGYGFSILRSDN